MPDQTPILSMPLIQASQAQKHITHNEALRLLDVAVQLAVKNRDMTGPPPSPEVGDRHIVAPPATGAWAGKGKQVAVYTSTGWEFFAPMAGWQAYVIAEEKPVVYSGAAWGGMDSAELTPLKLGINATADTTNRLTVSAPAALFNHEGGGHQLKINKASGADTASLLFQSGFSGRAEMGLAGNNDFSIKVSPDGSSFLSTMEADASSGIAVFAQGARVAAGSLALAGLGFVGDENTGIYSPASNQIGLTTGGVSRAVLSGAGLALSVPLTGAAVQGSGEDLPDLGQVALASMQSSLTYKGQLAAASNLNTVYEPGIYRVDSADTGAITNLPATTTGGMLEVMNQGALTTRGTAAFVVQRYTLRRGANGAPRVWLRQNNSATAASWAAWVEQISQGSLLGTVSQAGGLPTGAVIERGTGTNGEFVRFADGTLICTRVNLSTANVSTALGSLFTSANVTWTFPSAFIVAPAVSGAVDSSDSWLSAAAPATTSVVLRAVSGVTRATALTLRATAIGRWF